jgi:UDP-glucose 4-epimerase
LTTFATLLAARKFSIPVVHFASSSAVYGDHNNAAITEISGPMEPISNYGAMKLASEAQIRAAVESYLKRASVFRFPNVIGLPATHGVIIDLIRKARTTKDGFEVLGDGTQQKIYLHVDDLVDAMLFIRDNEKGRYNVFNIGPQDDGVSVRGIAEAVRDRVAPAAELWFSGGDRGWVGDVPRFHYDTGKLAALGWRPRMGSKQAVIRAVDEIARQEIE